MKTRSLLNSNSEQNSNWYIVYTYPNYEKKTYLALLKINIPTFLPVQNVQRQWSDRKKTIAVPLFPNYLFLKIPQKEMFKVLEIYGIKKFISSLGKPVTVPDSEINSIKKMLECPSVNSEHALKNGDKVMITDGPFKDMKGVLFGTKGKERLGIKIDSLNQTISIDISKSSIQLVGV
ncbi:UpxY family transcription antiterminator [Pedobacter sp. FW305-3-2-15-E-R2A2]|uniref:UpxY family transcription antiterminator n=1 Tax=Pedobacter sp. FW305-3-2-15-E-R2A2 TaxID=3140251 RepID=UPI003140BBE3